MSRQCITTLSLTYTATGAVAANRAIGFNGAQASVAGQKVLGVSPRAAATGTNSDVSVTGTALIEAGAAVAAGASLIVDAAGRAVTATGTAGEFIFADALEAGTAGRVFEVLLRR